MSTCDKPCIANIDGACVAEQCEGPIIRYQSPQADAQTEAKLYRLVAELFRDPFGEKNDGKERSVPHA